MPIELAAIGNALEVTLAADARKLGFLCHTGKFEDWVRDEASFALQVADIDVHVAREHRNMDVVLFDQSADGVTIWQLKHSYSINQWQSEGVSVTWPPRRGKSGWHGDYNYRLKEDLRLARSAAAKLRKNLRRQDSLARIFLTYLVTHASDVANPSTLSGLTQKYSTDFLRPWLKTHGATVGGFAGLRSMSAAAVRSWEIEGQVAGHDFVREPLPGPAGLAYSLMSFTWGPFS